MNVRITPRHWPRRTDLYGGVARVESTGDVLRLTLRRDAEWIDVPLRTVAEIRLDDEYGDLF